MHWTPNTPVVTLADYFTGTYTSECREHTDGTWHSDWLVMWDGKYIPITDWSDVKLTIHAYKQTPASR